MSGTTRRAAIASVIAGVTLIAAPVSTSAGGNGNANSMAVDGVLAYLGVIPAVIVRGHPESHPEGVMHGGAPEGRHEYHLVLALFDQTSGKRIESARVSVKIMGLGHVGGSRVDLEPMMIAKAVTWGTFARLPGADSYELIFEVVIPGRKGLIVFPFNYSHPNNG